jgi:Flp pilus assembly protein TadG
MTGRQARRDDGGAVSLFVVVITVALLAAVGLVVDGGGKIRALERADEGAREAARAGSQMLQLAAAVRGERVTVEPGAATRAARVYLDEAGIEGNVSVYGGVVTVSTRVVYRPVFLGFVGIGPIAVTGEASARPVIGDDEEVP